LAHLVDWFIGDSGILGRELHEPRKPVPRVDFESQYGGQGRLTITL